MREKLKQWYGLKHDYKNELVRTVIQPSSPKAEPSIETYITRIYFVPKSNGYEKHEFEFSKKDQLGNLTFVNIVLGLLKEKLKAKLRLKPTSELTLYDAVNGDVLDAVDSVTFEESSLDGERVIFIHFITVCWNRRSKISSNPC